jgi:hypothetical protein
MWSSETSPDRRWPDRYSFIVSDSHRLLLAGLPVLKNRVTQGREFDQLHHE